VSFILKVSNNIHQIPCLTSAELQETWTEEEKIPVKKDVPPPKQEGAQPDTAQKSDQPEEQKQPEAAPQQEYEIKKKEKTRTSNLQVDSSSHSLPP